MSEEPSPQDAVLPISGRLQQPGERHTPAPGVPKLMSNQLSIRDCLQALLCRAFYLWGNSVLCMSAKWSSFTFS